MWDPGKIHVVRSLLLAEFMSPLTKRNCTPDLARKRGDLLGHVPEVLPCVLLAMIQGWEPTTPLTSGPNAFSACSILTSLRESSDDAPCDDVEKEDLLDKGFKEEDDASTKVADPLVLDEGLKGEDDVIKKVVDQVSSLDSAIVEAREQEEEIEIAKATTEGVKEEGVNDSFQVLMELLKPLKSGLLWVQNVLKWERSDATVSFLAGILLITYKEWVGLALAACLLWAVVEILRARKRGIKDRYNKVVVCTASDKTSMESIVSDQQGLTNAHDLVRTANITLLKIQSLAVSRVEKHTNMVIMAMTGVAIMLVLFKYILMAAILSIFTATSKLGKKGYNTSGNRRLKEWWESIPVIPVDIVDQLPQTPM